jgi:hypothetical protein
VNYILERRSTILLAALAAIYVAGVVLVISMHNAPFIGFKGRRLLHDCGAVTIYESIYAFNLRQTQAVQQASVK